KIDKWVPLGKSVEDKTVKRVKSYVNDKKKRDEDKRKIEEAKENIIENIFNNKKVVFTGDMKEDRAEMRAIAIRYGAESPNSISKKTDILVVGENAGSKLTKAKEIGIKIVSEDDFWNMINKK
ncbi:MAG: BRCT domain-containing protein, partial [Clostridium sp.]